VFYVATEQEMITKKSMFMTQKNDPLPLLIAFVISGTILGSGAWWVYEKFKYPPPPHGIVNSAGEIATFAEVRNVPDGSFRYGGSTTFAPIRDLVDREILRVLPKFKLIYLDPISGTPGSGKGIEMLIENQLNLSQSSRSVKDEEQRKAQVKGFALQEVPVAIDGIAVVVNPNLNIPGLTVAQLKGIYTGKITNWQQLGGPNLAIIPYSRNKDGGTVEFFQDHVLDKEPFGNNVQYVYSTTPGLKKVRSNLGGIYYASAPEVVPQCGIKPLPLGKRAGKWLAPYQEPYIPPTECPNRRNTLNQTAFQQATYPITRNIFVIVKKNGQLDEQVGIVYANLLLTQQGQDLIQKAGFVSLR
jgi:phosphate transport system substrate-binding protein